MSIRRDGGANQILFIELDGWAKNKNKNYNGGVGGGCKKFFIATKLFEEKKVPLRPK